MIFEYSFCLIDTNDKKYFSILIFKRLDTKNVQTYTSLASILTYP